MYTIPRKYYRVKLDKNIDVCIFPFQNYKERRNSDTL